MNVVFRAFDGTMFDSELEAMDYELLNHAPVFVIVDDDPDIVKILEYHLRKNQISHKIFLDPLEAMNFISNNNVTHVYTDYHMKGYGISGKWIKEICLQKKIDCSIVSGDPSIADIAKIDFMKNFLSYMK